MTAPQTSARGTHVPLRHLSTSRPSSTRQPRDEGIDVRGKVMVVAGMPQELAAAVSAMYHLTESERLAMGKRARNYFERHFERSLLLTRLDGWMRELKQETGLDRFSVAG